MGIVLRDYQIKGVEDCMRVLQSKSKRGIVVQPTGAGKSHLISESVKRLNEPVLILQPSKELLKQNFSKFAKIGGKASICCASLKTKRKNGIDYTEINGVEKKCREVSRVTYATIGSIKNDVEKLKKLGVKKVIVDEIHLQSKQGSQMRKFIKKLGATNILGLTATPIYLQGGMNGSRLVMINRTFGSMFKSIVHVTQIKELVDNGYWTPLKYKIIKTDESKLELNTSGSDYTEHSQKLYYKSNSLKEQIVEEVKRLKAEGRKKIIVFVPSIDEANELYHLIPNSGVVHSNLSTKERDFFIDAFTNEDIPVVINVNVLATGYDNPEIDAIITTRPTASIAVSYQQIGRGCRLFSGKEDCIIVDFSGNTGRFGRVEELTFESVENYGWGMWGKNGTLLTDYPLDSVIRPTKKSIEENHNKKIQKEIKLQKEIEHDKNPEIKYGMWAGRRVFDIARSDNEKERERFFGWCNWFIKKQKEPSPYPKNFTLIRAIEEYLQQKANDFGKKEKFEVRIIGKIF